MPIIECTRGTHPPENLNCGHQVGWPLCPLPSMVRSQGIHIASELGEQGALSPGAFSTPVKGHPSLALPGALGALTWQSGRASRARLHKCLQRMGQRWLVERDTLETEATTHPGVSESRRPSTLFEATEAPFTPQPCPSQDGCSLGKGEDTGLESGALVMT